MAKSKGGSQRSVNQAAKKAASDGNITAAEGKSLRSQAAQNGANAAIAIAKAAVNNQAKIASEVQRQFGLDQTKQGVNLTSRTPLKPGVAPITGYSSYQTNDPLSGSTNNQAPVYTFFNKPKAAPAATQQQSAPAATTPASTTEQRPMNGMTDEWGQSVDSGLADLQAILKQQMEANASQTSLYMGMMQDMMSQMQNANAAAPQGAYAVTSSTAAPVTGAVQTQAIAPRKPVVNTDLSIPSGTDVAAGAGLNLAI